jgi:hypothetical protein
MLRTVSASGRHVGLLVHVPVAASVVHDHGLFDNRQRHPRWRPDAVRAGDAGNPAAHLNRSVCGR